MSDILKKSKLKGKSGVYSFSYMFCFGKDTVPAPEYLLKHYKVNIFPYIFNIILHAGLHVPLLDSDISAFIQLFFVILHWVLIILLQYSRIECEFYLDDEEFNMPLIKFTYIITMIINSFYTGVYVLLIGIVTIYGLLMISTYSDTDVDLNVVTIKGVFLGFGLLVFSAILLPLVLMWMGLLCQQKYVCRAVDDMNQEYIENYKDQPFNKVAPKEEEAEEANTALEGKDGEEDGKEEGSGNEDTDKSENDNSEGSNSDNDSDEQEKFWV